MGEYHITRTVFIHNPLYSGGKAQSIHTHHRQSVAQEAEDQLAKDKSVQALLSNFRSRRPLVLLIDDKYALFPYDLGSKGVTYAVLGFYTIIHAWGKKHVGFSRMEKLIDISGVSAGGQ